MTLCRRPLDAEFIGRGWVSNHSAQAVMVGSQVRSGPLPTEGWAGQLTIGHLSALGFTLTA